MIERNFGAQELEKLLTSIDLPVEVYYGNNQHYTSEQKSKIIIKVTETLFKGEGIFVDRDYFKHGTLNGIEDIAVAMDSRSRICGAFSDISLHNGKQFFITTYPNTQTGTMKFYQTENGMVIPEEFQTYAISLIHKDLRSNSELVSRGPNLNRPIWEIPTSAPTTRIERERLISKEALPYLNEKISLNQFDKVGEIIDRLNSDPNYALSEGEISLLSRIKQHQEDRATITNTSLSSDLNASSLYQDLNSSLSDDSEL